MTGHRSLSHEGVTERKHAKLQLKEEAARLQAVMNTVLDGLIIIDERGVVKMFNPAAVRIFGYQPEEVIGKNVKMLMPEPYHKEHDGYLKNYITTSDAKIIGIGREVSGRRKDGTTFPMELGVNETQMDGARMFVGTIRDVTERKHAERSILQKTKALAERESLHRMLMEGVADYAIIMLTTEGTINSWNSGAHRIKGYTAEEIIGQNFSIFYTQEDLAKGVPERALHKAGTEGKYEEEGLRVRKDGSKFWANVVIDPMREADGNLAGFVKVTRDITERKEAERQIKEESERMRAVMNTVLDGLIIIDEHGVVETFNPAAVHIFGYRPVEVIGNNVKMLMPEPYHKEHDGYLTHYLTTGEAKVIGIGREVSGRRKDGSTFPMELGVNETQMDGARMFVGTVRDITERKEAERRTKEEAARILSIMNTVLDGLITIGQRGIIQTFNYSATRIFGYKPEEIIGKNVKVLMPEPYHSEHDGYLTNYLTTGKAKIIGIGREVTGRRKDGATFPMELGINVMQVEGERAFVGTVRDITERKEAERRTKEEAARILSIMNTVLGGLITIDQRGIIQTFNYSATRIFGYEPEEVIGKNVKVLTPEPYHSEHDGYLTNYLTTGKAKIIGIGREVTGRRKDGATFPMELGINVMQVEGEHAFVGTVRDISDRKEAEDKILEYTKDLESKNQELQVLARSNIQLDEFAYIASHDLKAPLRVIDNTSKWLEEDLREHLSGENRENMNLLRGRVHRMETLLDDLLEYSRIGRTEDDRYRETLPGDALMRDIVGLLSPPEGFKVVVSAAFANIRVRRMPLQQILMNLIGNAIKHHDKRQGVIEVTVQDAEPDYVFVVRDDGPGIPAQFHEQIFKMFQTLKPRDQVEGSGMGLAMVRQNIEIFGGKIHLDSAEGKGSAFRFTWPKQQRLVSATARDPDERR